MISSRHLRVLWAVLLAVMGSVCVPGGASAATGRARAAEMFRKGCCCVTKPASGCCCETPAPSSLKSPALAPIDRLPHVSSASVERVHAGTRTGTCQCQSADPVAPGSKSQRASTEVETHSLAMALALDAITPETSSVSFGRFLSSCGSPPHLRLYLRNARLLI